MALSTTLIGICSNAPLCPSTFALPSQQRRMLAVVNPATVSQCRAPQPSAYRPALGRSPQRFGGISRTCNHLVFLLRAHGRYGGHSEQVMHSACRQTAVTLAVTLAELPRHPSEDFFAFTERCVIFGRGKKEPPRIPCEETEAAATPRGSPLPERELRNRVIDFIKTANVSV